MLSTPELAAMRAQQALAMPDTVTIQRPARVDDGAGGQTETWSTVATVGGRLSVETRQVREGQAGGKQTALAYYRVTLPAGTDVLARDRLVIGARTFEVQPPLAGGAWETARVCPCTEVL